MKIPVVLSTVHVDVGAHGEMSVDVDGEPFAPAGHLVRDELRSVLDQITTDLDTAVRVEVREADGTTYADIATPPEPTPPEPTPPEPRPSESSAPPSDEAPPTTYTPALAGTGFRPGEQVALAYVVARQSADSHGNASLNLPPALLAATRGGLVLLGLTSHTVAPVQVPA